MEFTRSLTAQSVALAMIEAGKPHLTKALVAAPELAEAEKELFVKMLGRLAERMRTGESTLSADEISSLFTFTGARAGEAVTNYFNGGTNEFDLMGMFDGKIPISADERMIGFFKKSRLASDCAQAYLDWHASNPARGIDPVLPLFEALKWCFRLSCTAAVEHLESRRG